MTYTYNSAVSEVRIGGFFKLLLVWKASVYKLIYKEFLMYFGLYAIISCCYHTILQKPEFVEQERIFRQLCKMFETYTDKMHTSLCFVLGFYVSLVVTRWWAQWSSIPWVDRLAHSIIANVQGIDDRGRIIRRTLIRYVNLASVMVYRLMSPPVMKRFGDLKDLVDYGFMTEQEHDLHEACDSDHWKYWMPYTWFSHLLAKAYDEGRVRTITGYHHILDEMNNHRSGLGGVVGYDWINIPLVYTQVVTVAVHSYFITALLSRQYLRPGDVDAKTVMRSVMAVETTPTIPNFPMNATDQNTQFIESSNYSATLNPLNLTESTIKPLNHTANAKMFNPIPSSFDEKAKTTPNEMILYVPFFTILEFLFYFGWLKVAEQLINPFGYDDDDFEIHEIIDRNFEISMRMVDDSYFMCPRAVKDKFWNDRDYSQMNVAQKRPFQGSLAHFAGLDASNMTGLNGVLDSVKNMAGSKNVGGGKIVGGRRPGKNVFGSTSFRQNSNIHLPNPNIKISETTNEKMQKPSRDSGISAANSLFQKSKTELLSRKNSGKSSARNTPRPLKTGVLGTNTGSTLFGSKFTFANSDILTAEGLKSPGGLSRKSQNIDIESEVGTTVSTTVNIEGSEKIALIRSDETEKKALGGLENQFSKGRILKREQLKKSGLEKYKNTTNLTGKKYNASFEAQKQIAQMVSEDEDGIEDENNIEAGEEDDACSLRERIERSILKERNKYYQKMLFESGNNFRPIMNPNRGYENNSVTGTNVTNTNFNTHATTTRTPSPLPLKFSTDLRKHGKNIHGIDDDYNSYGGFSMDSSMMFLNPDGGLQSDMLAASPRETLYSENGGGFGRDSRSESFYSKQMSVNSRMSDIGQGMNQNTDYQSLNPHLLSQNVINQNLVNQNMAQNQILANQINQNLLDQNLVVNQNMNQSFTGDNNNIVNPVATPTGIQPGLTLDQMGAIMDDSMGGAGEIIETGENTGIIQPSYGLQMNLGLNSGLNSVTNTTLANLASLSPNFIPNSVEQNSPAELNNQVFIQNPTVSEQNQQFQNPTVSEQNSTIMFTSTTSAPTIISQPPIPDSLQISINSAPVNETLAQSPLVDNNFVAHSPTSSSLVVDFGGENGNNVQFGPEINQATPEEPSVLEPIPEGKVWGESSTTETNSVCSKMESNVGSVQGISKVGSAREEHSGESSKEVSSREESS